MSTLSKWGQWVVLAFVVAVGGVISFLSFFAPKKAKRKVKSTEDLINKKKEATKKKLDQNSKDLGQAQAELVDAQQKAHKAADEVKKDDYSDAKSAADSFNRD